MSASEMSSDMDTSLGLQDLQVKVKVCEMLNSESTSIKEEEVHDVVHDVDLDLEDPHQPAQERKHTRKQLTLEQKIEVLQRVDNGETKKDVRDDVGIGKTQMRGIIRNKMELFKRWETGVNKHSKLKPGRKCLYDDINKKLWTYYSDLTKKNLIVGKTLLRNEALRIAKEMGIHTFAASNSWYEAWKNNYVPKKQQSSMAGQDSHLTEYVRSASNFATKNATEMGLEISAKKEKKDLQFANGEEQKNNLDSSTTKRRKRVALTLAEKVQVIMRRLEGEKYAELAKSFGVGRTQITVICAKKDIFLKKWENGENGTNKLTSYSEKYKTINDKLWHKLCKLNKSNTLVPEGKLKDLARGIAADLGISDFKASNGWIQSWKQRYLGIGKKRCGRQFDEENPPLAKKRKIDVNLYRNLSSATKSLKEKVQMIVRINSTGESVKEISKQFGVTEKYVVNMKNIYKRKILNQWESADIMTKVNDTSKFREVNGKLWVYYCGMREKNIKVGRSLLKTQALKIATQLGYGDFTSDDDWMNAWKSLYIKNLSFGELSELDAFVHTILERMKADSMVCPRLTFNEKMQIIRAKNHGKSCKEIALDLDIEEFRIQSLISRMETKSQRSKWALINDMEQKLQKYFHDAMLSGTYVNGIQLKAQALKIAKEIGLNGFKASTCWLTRWKSRNLGETSENRGGMNNEKVSRPTIKYHNS